MLNYLRWPWVSGKLSTNKVDFLLFYLQCAVGIRLVICVHMHVVFSGRATSFKLQRGSRWVWKQTSGHHDLFLTKSLSGKLWLFQVEKKTVKRLENLLHPSAKSLNNSNLTSISACERSLIHEWGWSYAGFLRERLREGTYEAVRILVFSILMKWSQEM